MSMKTISRPNIRNKLPRYFDLLEQLRNSPLRALLSLPCGVLAVVTVSPKASMPKWKSSLDERMGLEILEITDEEY